jgi:hypothetical protein
MNTRTLKLLGLLACCGLAGCKKKTEAAEAARSLFITSGACYSGNGVTTFTNKTASNLVYTIDLSSGQRQTLIADYYASPSNAGDSPVSLAIDDQSNVLVLVENTTTASLRRIERVQRTSSGNRNTYNGNTTALSAQLRAMLKLADGYLLVSKSSAVEKIQQTAARLLVGTSAWLTLTTPASSCAPSSTLVSSLAQLNNGMLVFAHAGASNARIGVVSALGYGAATDCKSEQDAPVATAFPTAMVYDGTNNKLIVAYGGSTTAENINSIYAYSIDETTGTISDPEKIYDAYLFGSTYNYLLFGISAMALDAKTNTLYVSSAISNATTVVNYQILKFKYNPSLIGVTNTSVLTSEGTFYDYGNDTKCISSMLIED